MTENLVNGPSKLDHRIATAEGMWQAETRKREQAEAINRNLREQNDALKKQLIAAARWAELSGNRELLKVMLEALQ